MRAAPSSSLGSYYDYRGDPRAAPLLEGWGSQRTTQTAQTNPLRSNTANNNPYNPLNRIGREVVGPYGVPIAQRNTAVNNPFNPLNRMGEQTVTIGPDGPYVS